MNDSDGKVAAGVDVVITTDVHLYSGGHVHDNNRPKGRLATAANQTIGGQSTLNGKTDANGEFSFVFGAEEASGTHTVTATCTGCQAPATANERVEIPGLMVLDPEPSSYALVGSKEPHPGNHWFSSTALVKIINLANGYLYDPRFKRLLIINDSSLREGGVFDIMQNWTHKSDKHGGHRKGIVVDVNNYTDPNQQFEDFAANYGIEADFHPSTKNGKTHPQGTGRHYHLLLLGAGKDG